MRTLLFEPRFIIRLGCSTLQNASRQKLVYASIAHLNLPRDHTTHWTHTPHTHTHTHTHRQTLLPPRLHESFMWVWFSVSTPAASPLKGLWRSPHRLNFTTKWQSGLQGSSHGHWGVFLVTGDTGPTSGRRARRLEGSVSSLRGVQVGCGSGHRVGVADVLRVQELSLVRHNLRGLLAVEHGEVSGHVDEDAGIRGQAAGGLSPHEGRGSLAGRGGRGGGAGRGGRAGLAGRWTSGGPGTGHHGDGLQEATPAGSASWCASRREFLLGPEAAAAAHGHHRADQDEGYEHRAHDQEGHVDGHCREKAKTHSCWKHAYRTCNIDF